MSILGPYLEEPLIWNIVFIYIVSCITRHKAIKNKYNLIWHDMTWYDMIWTWDSPSPRNFVSSRLNILINKWIFWVLPNSIVAKEEILDELKTGVNIPWICLGFNDPKLVVQDFAGPSTVSMDWWENLRTSPYFMVKTCKNFGFL